MRIGTTPMSSPELVFFVAASSRNFLGDYLEIALFCERYPSIDTGVVHFGEPSSEIVIADGHTSIYQDQCGHLELDRVQAFVYFPVSFEPEDVALRTPQRVLEEGFYHHRQWRVVTQWIEYALPQFGRCLNEPLKARAAANKLIQRCAFQSPLAEPTTWVGNHDRTGAFLESRRAVTKNLSEGHHIGEFFGDGRRLAEVAVGADGNLREAPTLLQERLDADIELRTYVIGDRVFTLELSRERTSEAVPDIRATKLTVDDVRLSEAWHRFDDDLIACTRRLGLSYAVFDLIPDGDTLYVLEVNSNGVWTGRTQAASPIRDVFHEHVAKMVTGAP